MQDRRFEWDDLLDCIEQGCVIPIVGRELITVPASDGKEVLLERYLADRLAERLGVGAEKPGDADLRAVANAHFERDGDAGRIYRALSNILHESRFATPSSLTRLAEITGFNLFVTTTFDSLLVQALHEQRPTWVLESFPASKEHKDIPDHWKDGGLASVHYLFGKVSSFEGDYAVTEEDYLEFIAKMQSRDGRPNNLFDAFREHHLLFLGCSFEDWLERFFIRTVRDERFSPYASRALHVVADREAGRGGSLTVFLKLYRMQVFREDGPMPFVDELWTRWHARHPKSIEVALPPRPSADRTPFQVFLSYDRHDVAAARRVQDLLVRARIRVFFDQNPESILQGEDWDGKIRRTIHDCAVFVPLISQHALSRHKGYLIKEWRDAIREGESRTKSARFIQPVSLDGTRATDKHVEVNFPQFSESEWGAFGDGGLVPDNFAQQLIALIEDLSEEHGGAGS